MGTSMRYPVVGLALNTAFLLYLLRLWKKRGAA